MVEVAGNKPTTEDLMQMNELDFAAHMNNYFRARGWEVHPEVEGVAPDGRTIRIDTILTMKEGLYCSLEDYRFSNATVLGIEYKKPLEIQSGYNLDKYLTQAMSYAQTVWEIPYDVGCYSAFKGRCPVFLLPSWKNKVPYPMARLVGRGGVGEGIIRDGYKAEPGDIAVSLQIRNTPVWEGYENRRVDRLSGRIQARGNSLFTPYGRFGPAAVWNNLTYKSGSQ